MKIVLALGGNALGNSPKEQLELVKNTAKSIVDLIKQGHNVVVGHGNGPQVGMINSAFIESEKAINSPVMPFAECGAMSQGYIGYHLIQSIKNELNSNGINKNVACVVTQVEVDKNDERFQNPTKPIGSFFTKEQAEKIQAETGYTFVEDSGRGYRRVVPSPMPKSIVEIDTIKTLIDNDNVVITVGGGGIPVINEDGMLKGVDAVIDKDMSCSLLAKDLGADMLIILTAVDAVCINFGKENQQELHRLTCSEAQGYIDSGEFGAGSMLPKIEACISFASCGKTAVITSLENAKDALNKGTVIEN